MKDKKTVAIYGAGMFAQKLVPLLQEEYNIAVVLDKKKGNIGQRIHGVHIEKPDVKNINTWPIVIAVSDTNSCVDTLKSLNCKQKIYSCVPYLHGFYIFECNDSYTIKEIIKTGKVFIKEENQSVSFQKTSMKNVPAKRRYFILGSCDEKDFFSHTGGPSAGLRFLWETNDRFHLLENMYVILNGLVFMPQDVEVENKSISDKTYLDWQSSLEAMIPVNFNQVILYARLDAMKTFLEYVGDEFSFTQRDVYLALDVYIAQAFLETFPDFSNLILAYHVQGTLSNEMGKSNPTLCKIYDAMQKEQLQNIHEWIFPTRGAVDGFMQTANNEMRCLAKDCHFNVLYSSYEPKKEVRPDPFFVEEMDALHDCDVLFATATFLYKSKGVERIPRILSLFKKQTGLCIKWILVGCGEMEQEVQEKIDEYLEPGDYIWYNKRFENQDNIFELFKRSDFYIMMHYISVSDLSTMQAMAYGCVPLLSNVGGNLEFCGFGNGILVDPNTDSLPLEEFMADGEWNKEYLDQKKAYNMDIIKRKFNDYQFLSGYRDFLYSIG